MTGRVVKLKRRRSAATAQEGQTQPSACLGKLCGLAQPDGVWVELPRTGERALARLALDCDAERMQRAIDQGQQAVLAFEDGDSSRPIVLGLIAPLRMPSVVKPDPTHGALEIEAEADGRRVRLKAQEEIVLQCGESSISLKRNGRIVIRGAYVETNAITTNRIRGGNVRIN
jgi:hypothetical protein